MTQHHNLVNGIPIGSGRTDDRICSLDRLGDGGGVGDLPSCDPHALADPTDLRGSRTSRVTS